MDAFFVVFVLVMTIGLPVLTIVTVITLQRTAARRVEAVMGSGMQMAHGRLWGTGTPPGHGRSGSGAASDDLFGVFGAFDTPGHGSSGHHHDHGGWSGYDGGSSWSGSSGGDGGSSGSCDSGSSSSSSDSGSSSCDSGSSW